MNQYTVELRPIAPFNFDATMFKPAHFPSADNAWQPGTRWQTMRWQGLALGLKIENCGTTNRPRVRLGIWSRGKLDPAFVESVGAEVAYRSSFNFDLAEFYRIGRADPQLAPALRRWRGLRPACYTSLYEYLILAIVLQNCTVRRSVSMMQTLLERCGTQLHYDGKTLYCMGAPEEIARVTEDEWRACKFGYRAKSIVRVTQAFVEGRIDEIALRQKSRAEQRAALTSLYGIGPASVDYILSDVFHRWDEISHISPWEQRIYSKLFFDRNPENPVPVDRLFRLFQKRFGAYQVLAVHYIWEDMFWRHRHKPISWLAPLIRL